MNNRLQGKVALVTGAAQGIGRAIARRLAAEGAAVAVCDIQAERAATTAGEIRAAGANAIGFAMDIADLDQVATAAEQIEAQLGPIGILVNNAGWERIMPFLESTPALWDRIIAINYRGTLNCCKVVAGGMKERGGGKVVSIASDAGRVGSTGEAVYSGCKAAIIGFSKTLARELAKYRVNVNVVCPGPTDTQLLREVMGDRPNLLESLKRGIPLGRLGEPDDLAGAVAFFA